MTLSLSVGRASVQQPSHRTETTPDPRPRSYSENDVRFDISLGLCAEYPSQGDPSHITVSGQTTAPLGADQQNDGLRGREDLLQRVMQQLAYGRPNRVRLSNDDGLPVILADQLAEKPLPRGGFDAEGGDLAHGALGGVQYGGADRHL